MASDAPENSEQQTAPQNPPGEVPDAVAPEQAQAITAPDPRLLSRKDASLREFLSKIDDYAPIVRALYPVAQFGGKFHAL